VVSLTSSAQRLAQSHSGASTGADMIAGLCPEDNRARSLPHQEPRAVSGFCARFCDSIFGQISGVRPSTLDNNIGRIAHERLQLLKSRKRTLVAHILLDRGIGNILTSGFTYPSAMSGKGIPTRNLGVLATLS
jgi:hypothetical protein